ncbi:MAG: peptidoglycan DD-metalloendopeptidase family protein [Cyanobacteria bacterium P01_D01_bin.156]
MTASGKKFIQIAQKSLPQASQLLSTLAAAGLLGTQAVMAQTNGEAIEIAIPEATVAEPVAPVAPVVTTPAPAIVEPTPQPIVQPTEIVPSTVETVDAGSSNYGTVFVEPEPAAQQPAPTLDSLLGEQASSEGQTPAVELVSPLDYGGAAIDPTDYSVGATMPEVIISDRGSGCQFSVNAGRSVSQGGCSQSEQLAAATDTASVPQANIARAVMNLPGVQQVADITLSASRDYYNKAAKAVVDLQLGEKFIFPLSVPASLTSLFGWRMHPVLGVRRFHTGSDLGAQLGTPVVATQSGRVDFADVAGGYGLMVVLRHYDDTLESRYAHLARLLVKPGEWVEQGEVVGLVGSTGLSTGPHLHFELRQLTETGWAVLNPDLLLKQSLATLSQALGNSVTALVGKENVEGTKPSVPGNVTDKGLPFRPAQPLAN